MSIINEFIQALDSEISALKKGKAGNNYRLFRGKYIKKSANFIIYQFAVENILIVLDDTPAKIEINDHEYDCSIISVVDQSVQIAIAENLGERIPNAVLKTNTWYLLEILKKKYEKNLNNGKNFDRAKKLFNGECEKIKYDESILSDENFAGNTGLDDSQQNALLSSLSDSVSVIWGPPGTGKTVTIAKAIECHIKLDRRVLLVSHANNAVDQALEKVASETKDSFYREGKLVRIGTPKAEKLGFFEKNYPLVLIDNIVEQRSKELRGKKIDLQNEIAGIDKQCKLFEYALSIITEIDNRKTKDEKLTQDYEEYAKTIDDQSKIKAAITKTLNEQRTKLHKARQAGGFKKVFYGLKPEEIEKDIKTSREKLHKINAQINDLKHLLDNNKENIKLNNAVKEKFISKLDALNLDTHNKTEIKEKTASLNRIKESITKEIREIDQKIEELRKTILWESKLVATTLTKTYTSKELEGVDFDVLVLDEASMSPLPMLFWAAAMAKLGTTIVGDFNQLPPICINDTDIGVKWLKRHIFNVLNLDDVQKATPDKVNLLKYQYRMHPLISEIPRKYIYDDKIIDAHGTENKIFHDSISGEKPICFIDTSPHDPWCGQLNRGRFNVISASMCISLAESLITNHNHHDLSIGIITPYKNQARLIQRMARDKDILDNNLRINTVHSFQGGEETIIIFDLVEGKGAKRWSMINEFNNKESARVLINVAMTRAEKKLYIVGNKDYIQNKFNKDCLVKKVINHCEKSGVIKNTSEIFNDIREESFDQWIQKFDPEKPAPSIESCDNDEFWPYFLNDMMSVQKEIIIFSPFITTNRTGKLFKNLKALIEKNVDVFFITKPPGEQPKSMKQNAIKAMKSVASLGVKIKFREYMHEKIAIIDKRIEWSGSLNILSHNNSTEYMKRLKGEETAKEVYDRYELYNLLRGKNLMGEPCQEKNCDGIIYVQRIKNNPNNRFYGCVNYFSSESQCKWTKSIKNWKQ
ncbi:MAG: AAA domain-containing protein [candidate division KSB1 bacterium]|nr:AAA domain-containing protein [candidate division KSB1 bacterium]